MHISMKTLAVKCRFVHHLSDDLLLNQLSLVKVQHLIFSIRSTIWRGIVFPKLEVNSLMTTLAPQGAAYSVLHLCAEDNIVSR